MKLNPAKKTYRQKPYRIEPYFCFGTGLTIYEIVSRNNKAICGCRTERSARRICKLLNEDRK